MEISLQQNLNTLKSPTDFSKPKSMRNGSFKVNTISCRLKEKTNFYEVLSLSSEGNIGFEEIKKAYRSKALEFHPDVCPPSSRDESTRKFVELRKAYETLSDPVSRKMYDYEMMSIVEFESFGGGHCYYNYEDNKRGGFSKKVWERQLSGLKKRSLKKSEKKRNGASL